MKSFLLFITTIITAVLLTYYSSDLSSTRTSILNKVKPLLRSNNVRTMTTVTNTTTMPSISTGTPRRIAKSFEARSQSEGAGATVRRSIGTPLLRNLTPFLMLDHFNVPPGAGFPDHPHRGQETITYLLRGSVDHEDFAGHKGTIGPGDLQFMTAGKGIVHAEMPSQSSQENVGMQLWVDLPADLKSCEPRYRDLRADEIPQAKSEDGKVEVKVISGTSLGVESLKDLAYTPVWLLDITIHPGGSLQQDLPQNWNAFLYTLAGALDITTDPSSHETQTITPYHNVVFTREGDNISASVPEGSSDSARFILVAGQPLDQPVVQYGPFVTTSKEAVYQAMMDFQTNSNGFERALNWESEIGKSMGRL